MAETNRIPWPDNARQPAPLHPAWQEFIRYCRELRHGEIQRLSIQDGLPVMAEQVVRKVKFSRDK